MRMGEGMRYLKFCGRCMDRAHRDPDQTPDDACGVCLGLGYVKAKREDVVRFLAHDPYQPIRA